MCGVVQRSPDVVRVADDDLWEPRPLQLACCRLDTYLRRQAQELCDGGEEGQRRQRQGGGYDGRPVEDRGESGGGGEVAPAMQRGGGTELGQISQLGHGGGLVTADLVERKETTQWRLELL